MKKITLWLATAMLLLTVAPVQAEADSNRKPLSTPVETTETRALLNRLEEIDAMDKSTLSRVEKKALRKEVREIEKAVKASGGVFLSVGALLLIIILLIVLL